MKKKNEWSTLHEKKLLFKKEKKHWKSKEQCYDTTEDVIPTTEEEQCDVYGQQKNVLQHSDKIDPKVRMRDVE